MKSALVGYSGFVGSNLNKQYSFDYLYNSSNIDDICSMSYDLLVFSGVPAVKWKANQEPEKDLNIILKLEEILRTVKAKKFVLISTIDVYAKPLHLDEDFDCSSLANNAYGANRLIFEEFCSTEFDDCTIVRLPGLFGTGLKKNVIYDLLNDNCLDMINTESSLQYYYLDKLWSDIKKADESGIKLINLFTEPIKTEDIVTQFFPEKLDDLGKNKVNEVNYDLYTKYSKLRGKSEKYLYTKEEVLVDLATFIKSYRAKK